jgi:hypothetical protein
MHMVSVPFKKPWIIPHKDEASYNDQNNIGLKDTPFINFPIDHASYVI